MDQLIEMFDKDAVEAFAEQLKSDKLMKFTQGLPEYNDARSWDKIRIEIEFCSCIKEFE